MKVRHFFAVCLASVVWSGIANPSLQACEQCESGPVCSACCQTDDRGLLDRIDSALLRRQPQLPRGCPLHLPALREGFRNGLLGNCAGSCSAKPSCGCELSQANCGCEITPASCGVELSGAAGASTAEWYGETSLAPQPQPPSAQSAPRTFQPRQQPTQRPPTAAELMPLQQHTPAEMVPTPDSQSDPFRDDSVRVLRRVPAQSVQLRPSGRAYRQSYDPQASHEPVRMSLSDQELSGQRRNPALARQLPRTHLDPHGSSRQSHAAPASEPGSRRPLPAVVTASALTSTGYEQQATSVASQTRNGEGDFKGSGLGADGVENRAGERQPVPGFNPLRSNSGQ